MSVEDRDLLTLKVMRLSQPQVDVASSSWCVLSPDELFLHHHLCAADHRRPSVSEELGPGGMASWVDQMPALLLPSTQGYIFTGELFNAYLNLMNSSSMDALRVSVQVTLQTDLHSHLLFDNCDDPLVSLSPGNCFDFSITHRLAEQSTYELTCLVSYQLTALSKSKSLRKSYRFNAQRPFSISHVTAHLPIRENSDGSRAGGSLIEVHLENVSSNCVWLSDVCLICAEGIAAKRIEPEAQHENNNTTTTQQRCVHNFKPKDRFSVVFALYAKAPQASLDVAYLQRVASFGYLQLQWRTAIGGQGGVCDYLVVNQHIGQAESLELRVVCCPSTVQVEEPFNVLCELVNRDVQTIRPKLRVLSELLIERGRLQLLNVETAGEEEEGFGLARQEEICGGQLDRKSELGHGDFSILSNDRSIKLSLLEGGTSRRFHVRLMALQQGFCKLCGLYVTVDDVFPARRTDPSSCLCDVLVM
eukprot:GHVS01082107.1.p1 GENE.GHVS01082107.1~~GHVS01082107.1.p1  ORF type:complete len:474 (+),score=81.47 GHVS01082107.1:112-1533(+)